MQQHMENLMKENYVLKQNVQAPSLQIWFAAEVRMKKRTTKRQVLEMELATMRQQELRTREMAQSDRDLASLYIRFPILTSGKFKLLTTLASEKCAPSKTSTPKRFPRSRLFYRPPFRLLPAT